MTRIILKPKKEQAIRRRHPWIFSGAIKKIEETVREGDVVEVFAHDGSFLAKGHYQQGSIAVRILHYGQETLDRSFWNGRLQKAKRYRDDIPSLQTEETNCYRLVHGAGDQLPGLIVDIYGNTAVVQCHSIGMHFQRKEIADALMETIPRLEAVYDKSKESLPGRYGATMTNGYLAGRAEPGVVRENGHAFYVDWEEGQKTGFFLDQRDNRQLLAGYVKGRKVLNAFCYSGGFSVYALGGGAAEVHSIDLSEKAMLWTGRNVVLNKAPGTHTSFTGDVLKFLKTSDTYDVMIVDPPAFAKKPSRRHNAVQGYKRLNAAAMNKIAPGGLLFTFSCSQVVDRALFYNTIVAAALESGREARVMHQLSQPADHPVNLFHPEGSYLKGLVVRVD